MITLDDLANRLQGVKKTPNGFEARCPGHEDKRASLSVGTGDDGRILLKCQAGCAFPVICGALDVKPADLFPSRNGHSSKPEIAAEYSYTDEQGVELFQVVRMVPKDFRQRHKVNGEWVWNMQGVRKALYRLPAVLDAVKRGLPVVICEGEKDCAALVSKGFCATCNPGGAGKWLDGYSESLRGADVIIVPDNDDPGRKHAAIVLEKLRGVARSVKTVAVPKGKDAHDFFAGGGTAAELISLIDATAVDRPPKTSQELIQERLFNLSLRPPSVRPVYSIGGKPIATPGNLQAITAQAKTGKSGFVNAMLAAPMAIASADTLGIQSANPNGFAVLHFDTEQSIEDHWHQVARAVRRGGITEPPPWLLSYCFTGFSATKAREFTWLAVEMAAKQFRGIHSIHIDGVADLVNDVNDPEECNAFIASLHALAIQHACPISNVLHFNPGTEKTRGHLGSQLERKAETNIRLDKDGETTEVWSEKQRRAPIVKGTGPRFRWSDEACMHVSVESGREARDAVRIDQLKMMRDEVFGERSAMRYNEIIDTAKIALRVSDRTAGRRFDEWRNFGLIQKSVANLWTKRDIQ